VIEAKTEETNTKYSVSWRCYEVNNDLNNFFEITNSSEEFAALSYSYQSLLVQIKYSQEFIFKIKLCQYFKWRYHLLFGEILIMKRLHLNFMSTVCECSSLLLPYPFILHTLGNVFDTPRF